MKASLVSFAVLSVLGLAAGCGNGDDQGMARGSRGLAQAATHEAPQVRCGEPAFAAYRVQSFGEALAGEDGLALRRLLGGRFEWFSINDWPTSNDDTFVAYRPAKLISFVRSEDGIGTDLRELAVSSPREGNYVDVSYSGSVRDQQRADDKGGDFLVGKGAVNCDGTIRVWSMAVKDSQTEAFAACRGRGGRRIDGLLVCDMK